MARIAKSNKSTAVATDAKPAKVGKVTKGATPAAKPAKPAKADKPAAERAPRGQFVGATVRVTDEGKAANPRGNAGELFAAIAAHRNPADAIGTTYTRTAGKHAGEATISSADLAYFVRRGLLAV